MYSTNNQLSRGFASFLLLTVAATLTWSTPLAAEWQGGRGNILNTAHTENSKFKASEIREKGLKIKWRPPRQEVFSEERPDAVLEDSLRFYHAPTIINDQGNTRLFVSRYGFDFSTGFGERDAGIVTEIDVETGETISEAFLSRQTSTEMGLGADTTGWNSLIQGSKGLAVTDKHVLFPSSGFNTALTTNTFELCLTGFMFSCGFEPGAYNIGISNDGQTAGPPGLYLIALNRDDLSLAWAVEMDRHPLVQGTNFLSTVAVDTNGDGSEDVAYITSSNSFAYDFNDISANFFGTERKECCTSMPIVAAVDLTDDNSLPRVNGPLPASSSYAEQVLGADLPEIQQERIMWKTYTTPMKPAKFDRRGNLKAPGELNYDGLGLANPNDEVNPNGDPLFGRDPNWWRAGGQWVDAPAVDVERGLIYLTTANSLNLPREAILCEKKDLGLKLKLREKLELLVTLIKRSIQHEGLVTCNGGTHSTSIHDAFPELVNAAGHKSFGHYASSILAVDMHTGDVEWVMRAIDWDIAFPECFAGRDNSPFVPINKQGTGEEVVACGDDIREINNYRFYDLANINPSNPTPSSINADFAQAPMLVTDTSGGSDVDLVLAGHKAGFFFAINAEEAHQAALASDKPVVISMDPDKGALQWVTQNGRGGSYGSNRYMASSDGKRIYVSDSQSDNFGYEYFVKLDGTRVQRSDPEGIVTPGLEAQAQYPLAHNLCAPLDDDRADNLIPGCNVGAGGPAVAFDGYISALNLSDGSLAWEFAPQRAALAPDELCPGRLPGALQGSVVMGSGSVLSDPNGDDSEGVLFITTGECPTRILALQANSGDLIWDFAADPAGRPGIDRPSGQYHSSNSRSTMVIGENALYIGLGSPAYSGSEFNDFPFGFGNFETSGDLLALDLCEEGDTDAGCVVDE